MNHVHGLQHLDVKPHNLFLVSNHVKVADFGLVSSLGEDRDGGGQSRKGGLTPLYSAPELLRGSLSRHSDQYSLAVVYQQMLTNTVPFWHTNTYELMMLHLERRPIPGFAAGGGPPRRRQGPVEGARSALRFLPGVLASPAGRTASWGHSAVGDVAKGAAAQGKRGGAGGAIDPARKQPANGDDAGSVRPLRRHRLAGLAAAPECSPCHRLSVSNRSDPVRARASGGRIGVHRLRAGRSRPGRRPRPRWCCPGIASSRACIRGRSATSGGPRTPTAGRAAPCAC